MMPSGSGTRQDPRSSEAPVRDRPPPSPAWIFVRFPSLPAPCLYLLGSCRIPAPIIWRARPQARAAVSSSFLTVAAPAPCSGSRCGRRDKGEWGYRFLRKLGPILRRSELIVLCPGRRMQCIVGSTGTLMLSDFCGAEAAIAVP